MQVAGVGDEGGGDEDGEAVMVGGRVAAAMEITGAADVIDGMVKSMAGEVEVGVACGRENDFVTAHR